MNLYPLFRHTNLISLLVVFTILLQSPINGTSSEQKAIKGMSSNKHDLTPITRGNSLPHQEYQDNLPDNLIDKYSKQWKFTLYRDYYSRSLITDIFINTYVNYFPDESFLATPPIPVNVNIPVLMYHIIQPEIIDSTIWITDELFGQHLAALEAYNYTPLTFDDYLAIRAGTIPPPDKPVILTIDDGFKNVFDYAYPLLQSHEMRATIFISSGLVTDSCDEEGRNYKYNLPFLCWDEIRSMDFELIKPESHGVTHPHLPLLSYSEQLTELIDSKTKIESQIQGHIVKHFAYPYGEGYNDVELHKLLLKAGYESGIATLGETANTELSPIYAIPRLNPTMENSLILNPKNPNDFFMRLVNPDFKLPNITLTSKKIVDIYGTEKTSFHTGDTIEIIISACNSGDPVNINCSLDIEYNMSTRDNLPDSSGIDIHFKDKSNYPFPKETPVNFSYRWTIPSDTPTGEYSISFEIKDEHGVLVYKNIAWIPAFEVVQREFFLPYVSRNLN